MAKRTNNDPEKLHIKLKHEPHQKLGVNSGPPEG
jgi:hypothetical protein